MLKNLTQFFNVVNLQDVPREVSPSRRQKGLQFMTENYKEGLAFLSAQFEKVKKIY